MATWDEVAPYTWNQVATGTWDNPLASVVIVSLTATPTLSVAGVREAATSTVLTATPTFVVQGELTFKVVVLNLTITPLFGAETYRAFDTSIWTRHPYPPQTFPFRLIAQEILTGKIVDWDLPVQPDFSYTTQLSGPTVMSGSFPSEISSIQELGLDGYAYFFHVEISGEIRATGIFLPPAHDETSLNFSCEGLSSIPHYVTWGSEMSEVLIDPLEVVRRIWTYVQSNPRSNVGVIVSSNTSNQTVGIPAYSKIEKKDDGTTFITDVPAAPYELKWWEAPNCGEAIDNLCTQTPFDYKERVGWNSVKTDVLKYYDMAFPRIGAPRDALLFDEDNVLEIVPVQEGDTTYASEVLVIGAGEGSATIRGYASENFGGRIRKMQVVTDKTITTVDRANALAARELGLRKGSHFSIDELVIHARHENATIGEYDIGDDIFVQVIIPWLPDIHAVWYRILSLTYQPAAEIVRLKVARSDSFTYSSIATPPVPNVTDDVRAAQDILDRMKSGETIYEDWTWPDCPLYVGLWNDRLLDLWEQAGSPSAQAWLQAYLIARI